MVRVARHPIRSDIGTREPPPVTPCRWRLPAPLAWCSPMISYWQPLVLPSLWRPIRPAARPKTHHMIALNAGWWVSRRTASASGAVITSVGPVIGAGTPPVRPVWPTPFDGGLQLQPGRPLICDIPSNSLTHCDVPGTLLVGVSCRGAASPPAAWPGHAGIGTPTAASSPVGPRRPADTQIHRGDNLKKA